MSRILPLATAAEPPALERDEIVLTVAEGKRLIGLGVAALPVVQRALKRGVIGIARGTTNGYVAEALLGRPIDRLAFTTALVMPAGHSPRELRDDREMGEIVIERGIVVAGKTLAEAARAMGPDDVIIKGANALNYRQQVAGILIQNATGGTIGGVMGSIMGRRITLVIPVGLEKEISADIYEASRALERQRKPALALWPVTGLIVTEIEALKLLAGVEALQIGAGGVAGAEGGVRLLLQGNAEQMQAAAAVIERVRGEPSLADAAHKMRETYGRRSES